MQNEQRREKVLLCNSLRQIRLKQWLCGDQCWARGVCYRREGRDAEKRQGANKVRKDIQYKGIKKWG